MTVLGLSVSDMGCRRCVREVTAKLRDAPGVETVSVDAARSHVTLTGTMALADAVAALSGTGYQARFSAETAVDAASTTPPLTGETYAEEAHR